MSYLHCSRCARAYNVLREVGCPSCGARAGEKADLTDEIVAAAEQLARAVERATPAQLDAARERIGAARAVLAPPPVVVAPKLLPRPLPPPTSLLDRLERAATRGYAMYRRARAMLAA